MGIAIDTVAFAATNPGAAGAAAVMATGDSAVVRNAGAGAQVLLDNVFRQGATEGFVRVRSPLLHDFVRGIMFTPSESPAAQLDPWDLAQKLQPQDALTIELSGGTAEVDAGGLSLWYSDLPGASARLHTWGDIAGIIANIKVIEVDFATAATAGQWQDTVITTTESLLKANTDYAVIGYIVDVAVNMIGLKGADTSNFRVCGPGVLRSEVTAAYFKRMSDFTGRPWIPVFNSANQGATFLSCAAVATGANVKGQLICAQLAHTL